MQQTDNPRKRPLLTAEQLRLLREFRRGRKRGVRRRNSRNYSGSLLASKADAHAESSAPQDSSQCALR